MERITHLCKNQAFANMIKVSIIIPCFNHGKYLQETLKSVEHSITEYSYEVIIVNDGSTDAYTNEYLAQLKKENYTVIFQENKGVCETRNVGIRQAKGVYILPIDADNNIKPDYIQKAVKFLDQNPKIDIVYCNALLIGDQTGVTNCGEHNLQRLMLDNYIDNCSMYRKSMWESLGGYESNRIVGGLEDWEFWLRAAFNGFQFYYLNEVLFEYRVLANSGIRSLNANKKRNNQIMDLFEAKMPHHFGPQYVDEYIIRNLKKSPLGFMFKLLLMSFAPNRFQKMVEQGKLRKHL